MKKIIAMIVLCFGFFGCNYIIYGKNYDEILERQAYASMYNAELACYRFSGAVETKNIMVYKNNLDWVSDRKEYKNTSNKVAKALEIATAKSSNHQIKQIKQCLQRLDEPKQKLKDRQLEEADEAFKKIIEDINSQTKNITFTCSQGDEIVEKIGLKFDKDIKEYALDTIQFKPIVSKELSQDIVKNIAKDLDKALFKDINKGTTNDFIERQDEYLHDEVVACAYKMQYYYGNLSELAMFQKSGIFADEITNAYRRFQSNIIRANKENANVVVVLSDSYQSFKIYRAMSVGAINIEIARINAAILASQNTYKAYSNQERQKQHKKTNEKIANLVIEKKKLEAMLKFIKEK